MFKNLDSFLKFWKNEDGSVEDSYNQDMEFLNSGKGESNQYNFYEALDEFAKEHPEYKQLEMTSIGGFDSCGYTIECNALTYLYNDKVQVIPINFESL